MNNGSLIFDKERTMGQTISFAFLIYRHNAKNFWRGMLVGVLPWIVASAILIVPYLVGKYQGDAVNPDLQVLIGLGSATLYTFSFLVLNTYVNEYLIAMKNDEGNQQPGYKEIVRNTYKALPMNILYFLLNIALFCLLAGVLMTGWFSAIALIGLAALTGSVIIIGLLIIFVLLLTWVLASYLCACTGPIMFIIQYEKVGFFKALEINFGYLHARRGFWPTILITLFGFLLMYIISINVVQPIGIIYGIIEYNSGSVSNLTENSAWDIAWMTTLILMVSWPLSSFIMMIIFGANYFNQKERALGTGLRRRIDKIGETKDYDSSKLELNF